MGNCNAGSTLSARMVETVEELEVQCGLVGSLKGEIALLKQAMLQGTPSTLELAPTKYFSVACIPTNEQIMITSMYLSGDAKLWWRTRTNDDVAIGRPWINTWEMLKRN
ncbi:hypothetical protein CK203_043295 [Vitis vinifera]|uniref:Retrotransposon gag domain-containing protein n=1 Tax=Vitis vinifera TaxID=29760 RepID=A0A438GYH2_VITVI|nr:hypothetical protein CK203_043295 [Vitis vinifera]